MTRRFRRRHVDLRSFALSYSDRAAPAELPAERLPGTRTPRGPDLDHETVASAETRRRRRRFARPKALRPTGTSLGRDPARDRFGRRSTRGPRTPRRAQRGRSRGRSATRPPPGSRGDDPARSTAGRKRPFVSLGSLDRRAVGEPGGSTGTFAWARRAVPVLVCDRDLDPIRSGTGPFR